MTAQTHDRLAQVRLDPAVALVGTAHHGGRRLAADHRARHHGLGRIGPHLDAIVIGLRTWYVELSLWAMKDPARWACGSAPSSTDGRERADCPGDRAGATAGREV
jgi:hypothetical protein